MKRFVVSTLAFWTASYAVVSIGQTSVTLPPTTVTKKDAYRQDVKDAIQSGSSRSPKITSEDRTSPKSAAHDRGAVDFRSKDVSSTQRHTEAANVSKSLGTRGTVVVEEVHKPAPRAAGPSAQFNTAYKNGTEGNTRTTGVKATETHTHAQPDPPSRSGTAGRAQ